jgi:hypothetical protein
MFRFAFIILLTVLACKKHHYTVPQSLIDYYSSTYCAYGMTCVVKIRLVKLGKDSYYGDDYEGGCPNLISQRFYYEDGTEVDHLSELHDRLWHNGEFKQVLWQCFR